MQPPPHRYADTLIALARTVGLTQQAIADYLGVSKTLVSLWKHGKKPMAASHIARLEALVRARMAEDPATTEEAIMFLKPWLAEVATLLSATAPVNLYHTFHALIDAYGDLDRAAFLETLYKEPHRERWRAFLHETQRALDLVERLDPWRDMLHDAE